MARKHQRRSKTPASIHELKITLNHSQPLIWRQVAVPSDIMLGDLHWVIQAVMPWTNSHMHQFIVPPELSEPASKGKKESRRDMSYVEAMAGMRQARAFGDPEFRQDDMEDETAATLQSVAPTAKSKLAYWYDFGDDWMHQIMVVKVGPPEPGVKYPICTAGKMACPPDDCGGVPGYYGMLDAIQDPKHPEHNDMIEWLGGDFDPERFSVGEANAALAGLK